MLGARVLYGGMKRLFTDLSGGKTDKGSIASALTTRRSHSSCSSIYPTTPIRHSGVGAFNKFWTKPLRA